MSSPGSTAAWQRLGKNKGGYFGETIAIQKLLQEIQAAALKGGWTSECILNFGEFCLRGYRRSQPNPRKRIYISTGIHGDEPAGPLAVLALMNEDRWPEGVGIHLCPCLNPTGFALNRRENVAGVDLNRDYRHPRSEEIRAHMKWLRDQPDFDLSVILHEDWEANGYYLYELNPDGQPSLAERILEAVARVVPIETAESVDSWPALSGIIRPVVPPEERPLWAESVFLITAKTRLSYTLEAPSDYPLDLRVRAHQAGVRAVLDALG
jgi:hypothetical protein